MVEKGFKALKMRIGRYSVAREAKVAAAILSRSELSQKIRKHPRSTMGTDIASAYQRHPWLTDLDRLLWRAPNGPASADGGCDPGSLRDDR